MFITKFVYRYSWKTNKNNIKLCLKNSIYLKIISMNINKLKNFYKKNGYFVYKIDKKLVHKARKEFTKVFSILSTNHNRAKIFNDRDIIKLYKSKRKDLWAASYDILKLHPSLYAICNSKNFQDILKIADIKQPCFIKQPVVRVDMPFDKNFYFKSHQDQPYNYSGSSNSITIWTPLQNTDVKTGTLKIVEKSHKNKKTYKYSLDNKKYNIDLVRELKKETNFKNYYKISLNDKEFNFKSINVKAGEVLVFSHYLVHKSGINKSNKIRFSTQFRYTDLSEAIL